jgi:O-antigen/teichoic acid export membrane protein
VNTPRLRALDSGGLTDVVRNPLLRNGHLLTLSSALVAILGLCFWTIAAWKYDADAVGRNSAAVSLMMLLVSMSQLNLSSTVVRFVPAAGRHTKILVGAVLVVGGCVALVVGLCAVTLVGIVSPSTRLFGGSTAQAMFVVATVASTIFIIQEGVLTGLRRTALVPLTNCVFAIAKMLLVTLFAVTIPSDGILTAWALAAVGIVIGLIVFLFTRAIPGRESAESAAFTCLPPLSRLIRFVALDYVGAICSVASLTVMPMMVLAELGAEQNAYFSMAWLVACSIFAINLNMGASLVVETSVDQSQLTRQVRHVLTHTGKLLTVVVVAVVVLAPYLLGVFGESYDQADTALRFFALAALPHLVVMTGISSARAQQRMALVLWCQIPQCVLALPLTWFLLPVMGMAGASVAWLITVSLIAGALLAHRNLWLTVDGSTVASKHADQRVQS